MASSAPELLKEEINKTQDAEHDLAKWKLVVTAALGTVAFGLSKDNSPAYWLLFLVPFVCAYVDLYDYQYRLRTLVIAKFLREEGGDPILTAYEERCAAERHKHFFSLGTRAAISSSIGVSVFGPLFYFLIPHQPASGLSIPAAGATFAATTPTMANSLLVSPTYAMVIWGVGIAVVVGLYVHFLFKQHNINSPGVIKMSEPNKQLVSRWFEEVWNRKSESAIDEIYAPKGVAHGFPEPDSALVGPEAFKAVHRNFCEIFPDLQVTIEDMLSEGDRVAVRFKAIATHGGANLGFPPTGKRVVLEGSSIVIVKNGQICEGWNYMDMGNLIAKLRQPT